MMAYPPLLETACTGSQTCAHHAKKTQRKTLTGRNAMQAFLHRFGHLVLGVLSGFDRLFFRGTLRNLAYPLGL
jgi:hypothetical protein